MIQLDHYGFHVLDSGIPILAQGQGNSHILDMELHLNARVNLGRRRQWMACPHDIDLSRTVDLPLPNDPLVDVMLPLPNTGSNCVTYVMDTQDNRHLIKELLRLTSPTGNGSIKPIWMYRPELLLQLLSVTNIQPLVVYGVREKAFNRVVQLEEAAAFSPRRLIVMLPSLFLAARQGAVTSTITAEQVSQLPLEQIGAHRLREFMLQGLADA